MMKTQIKILLAIGFLFFTASAFAQGSGSSSSGKSKSAAPRGEKNNFAVTRSLTGSVVSINNGKLVVKGKNGRNISLRVSGKTRGTGCLRAGQNVKIVYAPHSGFVSVVRCR